MIDHVSIPVRDLELSSTFYESVLAKIGYSKLVVKDGTVGFGKKYADFWLNHRLNLSSLSISDGFHVCLRALSIQQVEDFFNTAVALGAKSDGAPGYRAEYSNSYFAAFVIDPDGNKIEVVTFVDKQVGS
jgi:catechol 2,3-dioxygenase-like lactoylglutathione lyase family enzyme